MKEENMKLLDLQTGKYLELGKDWLYGGVSIYIVPTHYFMFEKSNHIITLYYDDEVEEIQCEIPDEYKPKNGVATAYIDGKFTKYVINGKEFKCGELLKCGSTTPINDAKLCNKSEPQGILKTLCDKTGAVVYGGRYVLLSDYRSGCGYYSGDVFLIEDRFYSIAGHYFLYKGTFNQDKLGDWVHTFVCNLFEEYSKQLRNEENKFDKLIEKLK